MPPTNPDRNLLYGILALQLGAVERDALLDAMAAWVSDRGRPLSLLLSERGAITPEGHEAVESVVHRLLERGEVAPLGDTEPAPDLSVGLGPLPGPADDGTELTSNRGQVDTVAVGPSPDVEATAAWTEVPMDGRAAPPTSPLADAFEPRFRILRPHAKGGLGEVFLAWDAELDRNVALKQIRPEYAFRPRARERFLREASINGNLEHPGIVPVYGLGLDAEGRPFYAMRFVQGESLKDALERFHAEAPAMDPARWTIGLRALLRRFLAVCDAIDYAHSRGVLHRDLKPANILLGKHGETLIIDWGLAKVLGRPEPDPSDSLDGEAAVAPPPGSSQISTVAGETLGSPPYMSPEQARGEHEHLQPTSDVYSLGATLYTILIGRPPVAGRTNDEILERVRRGEIDPPTAPSRRIPPPLIAVYRKAMRPDPRERYASARALADDLQRWLDDLPVAAYPDPVPTRLLRWSRRHRPLVSAGLALMLATVVGLAIFAVVVGEQKRRAEEARNRADIALQKEQIARNQARDHLRGGLDVVAQLVRFADGRLITGIPPRERRSFLQAAAGFLARFREREPGDLAIQSQTAQVARRLANLHRLIGQIDQASGFYDEAIRSFENLQSRAPSPSYADFLAETLIDQGDCDLVRGRVERAGERFARAVELSRENVKAAPNEPMYRRTLGRSLARLGSAHVLTRRSDASDLETQSLDRIAPLADDALPRVRAEVVRDHLLPLIDQIEWVQARAALSEARARSGDRDGGVEELRRARARTQTLVDQLEGLRLADVDFAHAWAGLRLAKLLIENGPRDEAAGLLDDAVTRLARIAEQSEEVPQYRAALAEARLARAALSAKQGRTDRAPEDIEAATAGLTRLLNDHPEIPEYAALQAEALALRADLARRAGAKSAAEARRLLEEAIRWQERASNASPEDVLLRERLDAYRARLDTSR